MNPVKCALVVLLLLTSPLTVLSQQTILAEDQTLALYSTESKNNLQFSEQTQNTFAAHKFSLTDSTAVKPNLSTYPPAKRDFRRLGYTSAMYLGAAVISFGILYAMPESVTNWDKESMKEKGIAYKWKENVKAGPVWDEDDWVLNWITHPYSGGVYYMTARSSGFTWYESFLYSALMSTCFWEYGIEAFAEIPSKQDLIITPVVGSMVGEGFFHAKKAILKNDRRVLKSRFLGYTSLFLMDPFNTLLDSFGYKEKTQTQLSFAPVGYSFESSKTVWGLNLNMKF